MTFALCRVDDRLIHGQVVIGWGRPLNARYIVLVDDTVAASPWEQDLYRMAAPDGVEIIFADTAAAIAALPRWAEDRRQGILLTGDLATMAALHGAHPDIVRRVNLGGLHHRADRVERLRYLFLAADERDMLARLDREGVDITAQDLPTSAPVAVRQLL
jgi:PTS system mannose-specific IIB component/fructoselysine and glucoselysine-specific PTS system IIB component